MISFTDTRGRTTYLAEAHIVMIHPAGPDDVAKVEMSNGSIHHVERDQVRRIVQTLEGSNI